MEKVTKILGRKQPYFNTVSPTSMVSEALNQMSCENSDYLIVIDGESFLGVLTEHDITSKAMINDRPLSKTSVKETMNTHLPVATINDTLEVCMQLMGQFNVRYLPVFENSRFCGIVSIEDIIHEAVYSRTNIFDTAEKAIF